MPCSAVGTKDLSSQVRGQNGLLFPKMMMEHGGAVGLSLVLVAVQFYPTVSQNGDFIPAVYLNQGIKPMNVIELDAAVIAVERDS